MREYLAISIVIMMFSAALANNAEAATPRISNVYLLINAEITYESGEVINSKDNLNLRYNSARYSLLPLAVYNAYEGNPEHKEIDSVKVTYELYDNNPSFSIDRDNGLEFYIYLDDGSRAGDGTKTQILEQSSAVTKGERLFETSTDGDYTVYKLYEGTFTAKELQAKLQPNTATNFVAVATEMMATYREGKTHPIIIEDEDMKFPISSDGVEIIVEGDPVTEPDTDPLPGDDPSPVPDPAPGPDDDVICIANNQDCPAENTDDVVANSGAVMIQMIAIQALIVSAIIGTAYGVYRHRQK